MKRTRKVSDVGYVQRFNKRMVGSLLHNMIREDNDFLGLESVWFSYGIHSFTMNRDGSLVNLMEGKIIRI
ncbi:conserved domain protein [Paenibacillus sp. HGF5]|nr:conserved domain protein [Paenibacillus sp. HGF5]